MLQEHFHTRNWKIDTEFPLALLVDIFRPFLYNFLITFYNFRNLEKNAKCQDEWEAKLHRMYKDNNNFGVKMYKDIQIFNVIERKEIFNTNHINFYGKKIENHKIDHTWKIIPERESMLRTPPISFLNQVMNSMSNSNEIFYRTYDNISPITIRNNPNVTSTRRRITPVATPSDTYSVSSSISVEENINEQDNNSNNSEISTENINEEETINENDSEVSSNYSEVSLTMLARNEEENEEIDEEPNDDI